MARCKRCHRVLSTDAAKAAGYGAVCYRKMFGKPLPSGKEPRTSVRSRRASSKKVPKFKKRRPVKPIPHFTEDIKCYLGPDGEPMTNVPQRIIYHSPDGFSWGYDGSGPADLALNILSLYVEEREAYELHQEFKRCFISTLPPKGGVIRRNYILEWINDQRLEKSYAAKK